MKKVSAAYSNRSCINLLAYTLLESLGPSKMEYKKWAYIPHDLK